MAAIMINIHDITINAMAHPGNAFFLGSSETADAGSDGDGASTPFTETGGGAEGKVTPLTETDGGGVSAGNPDTAALIILLY
jgi:hypothetical protein